MSSTAVDILIFGSALLILGSCVALIVARYWARHIEFAAQREHHITRAEIDKVLRCVEPDPGPPEKVIEGLMPPPR